jgi:LysM repeat protein
MSSLFIRIVGVLIVASMLLFPAGALAAPNAWGETVHVVQWGETLSLIADRYGVTVEAILAANDLHNPNFVYVGQRLTIPAPGHPGGGGRHVVAPGETLTSIAFRYSTTVAALAAANGLSDTDFIYVGQVLNIPGGYSSAPSPSRKGCDNYYQVQWGDTLSGIAWRHRTTANDLMQSNGLYSDFIHQGQRLCVPPGGVAYEPSAPPSHYDYYSVRPGDTLAAIASRFGVSQTSIVQANNLTNASFIYVEQRLLIVGTSTPVVSPRQVGPAPAPPPGYVPPQTTMGPAPAPPPEYVPPQSSVGTAPAPPPGYSPPGAYVQPVSMGPAPAPGYYPPETMPETGVTLPRSREPVVIRAEPMWTGSQTAISVDPDEITTLLVMTHNGEKLDVMIRSADGFVARGVTGVYYEYSWIPTFAFRGIPGGEYEVWIEGQPSKTIKAKVEPGQRTLVEFKWEVVSTKLIVSPAGWTGQVVENTSGTEPIGAASILVVRTGAIGNKIRVTAPGGYEGICITGTKPEHGPGACDVGGLNAGTYQVILDGADIAVEVYLDGVGNATVEFWPA